MKSLKIKKERMAALEARLQESAKINQQLRQDLKTVSRSQVQSKTVYLVAILLTCLNGVIKVINKHSSGSIYKTFVQSYLVFNNVLKMLGQKHYIYIYYHH